jgi:hypothetical protein
VALPVRFFPDITWENMAVSEAHDRRVQHVTLGRQVTPEFAQRTADLGFAYPQVAGGVIAGMAQAGIDPMSPEADQIRDRSQELAEAGFAWAPKRPSFWDHGAGQGLKAVTRGAFTLFESLYNEVTQGTSAFIYGLGQGKGIEEAAEGAYGYSPGAIAVASALQGKPVNLGTGFFAGGTLSPETEAALAADVPYSEAIINRGQQALGLPAKQQSLNYMQEGYQKLAGTEDIVDENTGIRGLTVTPGRFVAASVTEPGTTGFNLFSGGVDFASNIFLDPANAAGGFVSDIRGLNNSLVSGARSTILRRNVDDWLASAHGTRTAEFIAGTDDYRLLHGLFRKNAVESNVDAGMIYALRQETNPDAVKEILSAAVRGGSEGQLKQLPVPQSLIGRATGTSGLAGVISRGMGFSGSTMEIAGLRTAVKANRQTTSWFGRMAAEVGANYLRFDDVSTATDDLGQWLQAAGVAPAKISEHMAQVASIPSGTVMTPAMMWGAFKSAGHTVAQKMIDEGLDKEIANSVVKAFTGSIDDYRKFWINEAGNPTMFAGSEFFHMVNGDVQAIPSAQLFSEFMDMGIPLPDMRRIRNGLRRASWAKVGFDELAGKKLENVREPHQIIPRFKLTELEGWDDLGPGVLTQLTDKVVQGIWKPLVLLRVAWPVRVIGEEQVRMGAVGLSSAINHPLHYLSMAFGRNLDETVTGNKFTELTKFRAGMSRRGVEYGTGARARDMYGSEWLKVDQNDPRWWDGMAISLQQLADDPLAARIAKAIHEAEAGKTMEQILRPIKDEFADPTTELGQFRLALAADSGRWDVVNIRELADSVIDDRLARLGQHTGSDYIKANHVTKEWEDAYGNQVIYNPEIEAYVNTKTGQQYPDIEPPGPRANFEVSMFPELVDRSSPLTTLTARAYAGRGDVITDDAIELGEWTDALEDFADTLHQVEGPTQRTMQLAMADYGDPRSLSIWIDRNVEGILSGDPAVTDEFARRAEDLQLLINEAREHGKAIVPPSGKPDFRAVDIIQMAGDPDLVRSTLAGRVPLPGQPSLDELASKQSWTHQEIVDMIGPTLSPTGPYRVKPMPQSMLAEHGKKRTHIWTEPVDPANPNNSQIVQIAHEGVITGHIIIKRAPDGSVEDIGMFHVAKGNERTTWIDDGIDYAAEARVTGVEGRHLPGANTDAAVLLRHVLGEEKSDPAALYDLAFGGVPVREWLTQAGHSPEGLTMADLAEFMRAQLGASWSGKAGPLGPMPSIALTNDGASSLARTLMILGSRGAGHAGTPASWPQRGIKTHLLRPPKPELLEAVATGKYGDHTISSLHLLDETEKVTNINAISQTMRENLSGDMASLPNWTKVASAPDAKKLDTAVDHIFNVLGSRPSNKLSRSPAFRQFYYKRVGEMLPYVDNATRDELVTIMRDQGVRRGEIRAALKNSVDNVGANDLTKADVDEIAKAFALQETKRLLYDLTKKNQFFDITRNIFPFGEAWLEIMTTWGRLINENPQVIRRMQQVIEGARQEGIFYNDPATGEEVFGMPHLNALSSLMGVSGGTGQVSPEYTGRVEGVNLVLNSFLPGVGPIVQMPAAAFGRDLMDKPELRWARDLVFPFGYPEADSPGAIANSVMPAWFRKGLVALGKPTGDDSRLYNNTVIDVLRAMEINGEITPQTDPSQAIELARSRARNIYVLRTLQQFVGPTGASVRWDVRVDPTGEAFAYQVLATEYRQMVDDNDGDRNQAFNQFVATYGFDPAGLITAKTEQVRPRGVTNEALDFQQQNPALFAQMPLTAYYVAPDPPDGEFSYNAYLAQLRNGDRVGLTPDQWLTERNRLLGSIAYEKLRRTAVDFGVRDDPAVAAYLRTYRYQLMETYPGYGFDNVGAVTQPEQRQFMAEFETWRSDPSLARTNAGEGLNEYLNTRDTVLTLAQAEYGVSEEGFATAKSTSLLREYLLTVGQTLIGEYPDFGTIFTRHYLWEVEDPAPIAPTELLGVDLSGPDPFDDDDEETE